MSASNTAVMDQMQRETQGRLAQSPPPGQDPSNILQAKEAALEPLQGKVSAAQSDLIATPQPAHTAFPETPKEPLVDPKQYEQFSFGLIAMALIGGAVAKGNWMGVASTMNGAMKGFLEGNQARAQEDWKRFEADYDKAIQAHKDQEEDYAQTINNKKLTINQMLTELQWKAAKYDDQYKLALARDKRVDELHKQVFDMAKSREELQIRKDAVAASIKAKTGGFEGEKGELLAALTAKGVSTTGFRSRAQMQATLQGLIDRYPGATVDEIADLVAEGQIDFAARKKETQTAAAILGRVITGENELEEFHDPALAASNAVPRGSFVPFTQLQQKGEAAISDPNLKALYQWTNAVLNAYDIVAARGGTDKEKRAENRKNLETADSQQTYQVALDVMMQEVAGAKRAGQRAISGAPVGSGSAKKGPAIGTVEDGHRFKGGDPADPASWEIASGQ